MAINVGDAILYFVGDTSGLLKSVDEAAKIAQAARNDMERMGDDAARAIHKQFEEVAKKLGIAFTAIGGSITGVVAAAVKAFSDQERVARQLDAVLKSTGSSAGVTANEIKRMASELQAQTGISDDAIISANTMLLTFTNIGKDVFPQATRAVLDLATGMNEGMTPSSEMLSHTAIALGKALQDPITGVQNLRRVGVQLSEDQEKQIRGFMAVNDVASAQKMILDEVAKQFGGRASESAKTFSGQLNLLKENFGDLLEIIGSHIVPKLTSLTQTLSSVIVAIENWTNAHPILTESITLLTSTIGGLLLAVGPVLIFLPKIISYITAFSGAIPALLTFINGPGGIVVAVGAAALALQQMASAWSEANKAGDDAADVNARLPGVLQQVMDALDAAGVQYDKAKIASMDTGAAIDCLNKLYYEQVTAVQAAGDGVEAQEQRRIELVGIAKEKVEEIEKAHAEKVKEIQEKAAKDAQKSAEKLADLSKDLADKQKDIAQNFGDTVRDIRDRFNDTIAQMQRDYRDKVRDYNISLADMEQEYWDERNDAAQDYYDAITDAEYEYTKRREELMQSGDYEGAAKLDREFSDRMARMQREYMQDQMRAERDYTQAVERLRRKMELEEQAFRERLALEEQRAQELERVAAERQERETAKAVEEYNRRVEEHNRAEREMAAEREKAFADLQAKYDEATRKLADELGVSVEVVRNSANDAAQAHKRASDESVAAWLEMLDWWESSEGIGAQNNAVQSAANTAARIEEANRESAERVEGFWTRVWNSVKDVWSRLTNFGEINYEYPDMFASGGRTKNVPIIANEEGPEMAVLPDGRRGIIGDGMPGVYVLPVGTYIHTATETAKMLFQSFAEGGIIQQLSTYDILALRRMREAFSNLVDYGRNTGQLTSAAWGILKTAVNNGWSEIVSTAKRLKDGKFLRVQGVGGLGGGTWLSLETIDNEKAGRIQYRDSGNDVVAALRGLAAYARGGQVKQYDNDIVRGIPDKPDITDNLPEPIDDSFTGTVVQKFRDGLSRAWHYLPFSTEMLIEWMRRISAGWPDGLTKAWKRDGRIVGYTGNQGTDTLSLIRRENGEGSVSFGRHGAWQRLTLPEVESFARGGMIINKDDYRPETSVVININGMTVREEADIDRVSRAIAGRVKSAMAGGVY